MHLLLVEDDRALATLLRKGLQEGRYVVDVAHTGDEALDLAMSAAYAGDGYLRTSGRRSRSHHRRARKWIRTLIH